MNRNRENVKRANSEEMIVTRNQRQASLMSHLTLAGSLPDDGEGGGAGQVPGRGVQRNQFLNHFDYLTAVIS